MTSVLNATPLMRPLLGLGLLFCTALSLAQSDSVAAPADGQPQAETPAEGGADPAAPAAAEPEPDYSIEAVLQALRAYHARSLEQLQTREARYQQRLQTSLDRVAAAKEKLQRAEEEGRRLEAQFEVNRVELDDKARILKEKIGALKELFGVFQQNASDLIGAFNGSPTSLQYPNRDRWLEGFANRMKNASEVTSADDIKTLWYELQREIAASNDIVRLRVPVMDGHGEGSEREVVRVGTFNLITDDPAPAYLVWKAGRQQVVELPRQPAGPYTAEIEKYLANDTGLSNLSVDPTQGVLLSLLIEKPTLRERIDQGGLVGYMILGLGALALVLAFLKLIDISILSVRVGLQRRQLDAPSENNPLGRLLLVYQQNRRRDPETLELRLHEQAQYEQGRVHRFTIFLKIIAAVAPLMGLLGTVVGMINTFQAITLYGTGDPQTMAGGISQALITTVLGLVVAVPAVLLHAIVSARGRAVVNVVLQQRAALTGDRLEQSHAEEAMGTPASIAPAPA